MAVVPRATRRFAEDLFCVVSYAAGLLQVRPKRQLSAVTGEIRFAEGGIGASEPPANRYPGATAVVATPAALQPGSPTQP